MLRRRKKLYVLVKAPLSGYLEKSSKEMMADVFRDAMMILCVNLTGLR